MKEKKHYVSLTFKGGNAYHEAGKTIKLTDRLINIGETADCDVRYENDGLKPEYYATIVRNDDGESWRIVKRSQHTDISIVGKGTVGYAHPLEDGDLLQFGNSAMTLCFHSHHDHLYAEEGAPKQKWSWGIIGGICAIGIIALLLGRGQRNDISEKDVVQLEESIYLVKVDSVKQILLTNGLAETVRGTKLLTSDVPTGTAFMTTDGKLITARHCVEYWLGKNISLTLKVSNLAEDDIVRWAIETETFNQRHKGDRDSLMQLESYFSIYNFLGEKKYSFVSTDKRVHINKQKDGLFLLADFSDTYYWRSIQPYFTDTKMMMGDILWIDGLAENGKIQLGTADDMQTIERGTRLMVSGYPMTGTGDKQVVFAPGSIKRTAAIDTENLFFESNINHGFSGGPVLIKSGNSIIAIGVVSRVDSVSSGLFKWAVPVTEVRSDGSEE